MKTTLQYTIRRYTNYKRILTSTAVLIFLGIMTHTGLEMSQNVSSVGLCYGNKKDHHKPHILNVLDFYYYYFYYITIIRGLIRKTFILKKILCIGKREEFLYRFKFAILIPNLLHPFFSGGA